MYQLYPWYMGSDGIASPKTTPAVIRKPRPEAIAHDLIGGVFDV